MTRSQIAIASILVCLSSPGAAQSRIDQVQALIETVHAEQRVFLTCTSLMPELHQYMLLMWEEMVERSDTELESLGFSRPYRMAFRATSRPSALMLSGDTPFADLVTFCSAYPELLRKTSSLDLIWLDSELGRLGPP